MALTHSIGRFTFLGLSGEVSPPKEIVSADERPAVNGTELTKEGTKGRPFIMFSWVDAESYASAHNRGLEYRELVGGDPVELIQADCAFSLAGFKVAVLDVTYKATAIGTSHGGLNPPSLGYLEAQWTLLAILL